MNRPSKTRQKHRRPSIHKMNRRQANHKFSRETQRFNFQMPSQPPLPDHALLASQEMSQSMASHDIEAAVGLGDEALQISTGRMCLRALAASPHFQPQPQQPEIQQPQ